MTERLVGRVGLHLLEEIPVLLGFVGSNVGYFWAKTTVLYYYLNI
jgi:hypothetical protein